MTIQKIQSFSLIEILLVVAVLITLASSGLGYWGNYVKNIELESSYKTLVSDIKNTQSKAMTGENNLKWGIHFVNGTDDYYEVFSTTTDYSTGTIAQKNYLQGNVVFTTPSEATALDVIFSKITGISSPTTVIISSNGETKNINITALGRTD